MILVVQWRIFIEHHIVSNAENSRQLYRFRANVLLTVGTVGK